MTESDDNVCIVLYSIAAVIVDLISAGMAYLQTYTSIVWYVSLHSCSYYNYCKSLSVRI